MKKIDMLAAELTVRYGVIKRARGCFLYTQKGTRLTDLYQEGGKAILGWGGGAAFTVFKNVLNRGVTGSFDTGFTPRIAKAVSELLCSPRIVYVYTDKRTALESALSVCPDSTSFWKPWSQGDIDWRLIRAVIVEPPLPWAGALFFMALSAGAVPEKARLALPSSERIAAPLAAAAVRSVYDMIAALQAREEKDWFCYDTVLTDYWTRRGPYLYPKVPVEHYDAFILHCLECGLVISPDYDMPSIVPYGADKGVFATLQHTPFVAG